MHSGYLLTPKRTFLRPKSMPKTSKIVGMVAVSNEYTSKILGQDVSLYPVFVDSIRITVPGIRMVRLFNRNGLLSEGLNPDNDPL